MMNSITLRQFDSKKDYLELLNLPSNSNGLSELHHAVYAKNFTQIRRLVQAGVDVNAQDAKGNTPFHLLFHILEDETRKQQNLDLEGLDSVEVAQAAKEMIKLFLISGANLWIKTRNGLKPFDIVLLILEGLFNADNDYNVVKVAQLLLPITYVPQDYGERYGIREILQVVKAAVRIWDPRRNFMLNYVFKNFFLDPEINQCYYELAQQFYDNFYTPDLNDINGYPECDCGITLLTVLFDYENQKEMIQEFATHLYDEIGVSLKLGILAAIHSKKATDIILEVLKKLKSDGITLKEEDMFDTFCSEYSSLFRESLKFDLNVTRRYFYILEEISKIGYFGDTNNNYEKIGEEVIFMLNARSTKDKDTNNIIIEGRRHYQVLLAFCGRISLSRDKIDYIKRVFVQRGIERYGEKEMAVYFGVIENFLPDNLKKEIQPLLPLWKPSMPSLKSICRKRIRNLILEMNPKLTDRQFTAKIHTLELPLEVIHFLRFLE